MPSQPLRWQGDVQAIKKNKFLVLQSDLLISLFEVTLKKLVNVFV